MLNPLIGGLCVPLGELHQLIPVSACFHRLNMGPRPPAGGNVQQGPGASHGNINQAARLSTRIIMHHVFAFFDRQVQLTKGFQGRDFFGAFQRRRQIILIATQRPRQNTRFKTLPHAVTLGAGIAQTRQVHLIPLQPL